MARARPNARQARIALGALFAAVLVVATAFSCTRSEPTLRAAGPRPPTTTTTEPPGFGAIETSSTSPTTEAPSTDGLEALPSRTSLVATAKGGDGEIAVYTGPSGAETASTIARTGEYGQAQVFLVTEERPGRLHVLLPVRPNGSNGWIDRGEVELTTHDYQIQVSLSGFRMLVQKGPRVVIDTPIGVGTRDTPTVGGDFYTWVLLDPTNAGYGSYAYGLSGFSTLDNFAGGNGRMGIHGTTDDTSIGRNVSHGCVRVPDDIVVQMVEGLGLPLGIPVTINA